MKRSRLWISLAALLLIVAGVVSAGIALFWPGHHGQSIASDIEPSGTPRPVVAHGSPEAAEPADTGPSAQTPPPPARQVPGAAYFLSLPKDGKELRQALAALSKEERRGLIGQLLAGPATANRNAVIALAFQMSMRDDPANAMNLLAAMPSSMFKADLARQTVDGWIAQSPEAAARWLKEQGAQLLDPAQVRGQIAQAVQQWMETDPRAATVFADGLPPDTDFPPQTSMALTAACAAWSQRDPQAAFAWAQALDPSDPRKNYALQGALTGLVGQQPQQAAAYVQQQIGTNPDAAGLAALVAGRWVEQDPAQAAAWALSLNDPDARNAAIRQLTAGWTRIDSQAAAQWAGSLPAGDTRGSVWETLASTWSFTDPSGANAWLGRLPAGPDRDQAVAAYVKNIANTDPEKALGLVQTLGSDKLYSDQTNAILYQWQMKDATAAARWAAANGVALPKVVKAGR